MDHGYLYLVFLLILAGLVLTNSQSAASVINAAGGQVTGQIMALQGHGSGLTPY